MSEKNMQKKEIQRFVTFCRLMPVLGGILAVFIGIIVLIWTRTAGENVNGVSGLISIFTHRVYVEPIVSAAEQFPDFNIQEEFLTINDYSRPGDEIDQIQKIVIHYTGNPGTTAQANRDYFESLAENPVTSASSHFVIGLNG